MDLLSDFLDVRVHDLPLGEVGSCEHVLVHGAPGSHKPVTRLLTSGQPGETPGSHILLLLGNLHITPHLKLLLITHTQSLASKFIYTQEVSRGYF